MNESTITVQGYVGSAPVLRQPGGHYVANFRLACTPRRFDRKDQKWVDTATSWYTVSAWRRLGQNVASSVKQGDPVVVTGQLVLREWTSSTGEPRQSYEIEASSVGHDLSRTMTSVVRMPSQIDVTAINPQVAPEPIDEDEANLRQAQAAWGDPDPAEHPEDVAA